MSVASGTASPWPGVPFAIDARMLEDFLATTSLFARCDRSVLAKVAPHLRPVEVPGHAVLVQAGEPARGVGILFRGSATVLGLDAATGESVVREMLHGGDHFGEAGALL